LYSLPDGLGAALIPPQPWPLRCRGARRGAADLDDRPRCARRGNAPSDAGASGGSQRHGRRRRRYWRRRGHG